MFSIMMLSKMLLELPVAAGSPIRICLPADTEFVQYAYVNSTFTSNSTQHICIVNAYEKENLFACIYISFTYFPFM